MSASNKIARINASASASADGIMSLICSGIIAQEKLAEIQAAAGELLALIDAGAQDAQPGKFNSAVERLRAALK